MKVVVFGASGYVGGRLIPLLLERGHSVRAVTRRPASLGSYPWRAEVDVVSADMLDRDSLASALEGMDAAYYLVHSMERSDFEDVDRQAAINLADGAAAAGLSRIIYLGGLGRGDLSPHLASRQEVGRILSESSVPVTEFRAAVIIGSGSLSFEMTRHLTEVLPVMVTPKWVTTRCQPIAIRDVLAYLAGALDHPDTAGRIIEIGGPDVLSYADMMHRYAKVAGLRRRVLIRVPVLSLGLSARWVGLVTPLSNGVAAHLVDSLQHEVVVTDPSADELIPLVRIGYDEAVNLALERTRGSDIPTRWGRGSWQPSDPMPSDPDHAFGTILRNRRTIEAAASADDVAWAFMRVGGVNGYYAANWAWSIRGLVDKLFGGAGLRRGRRHPEQVNMGEPLDFWRVVGIEPGVSLDLKAEMLLPGEAWLSWRVTPTDTGSSLVQTAWFVPRGLFGRLYWYALVPFHGLIFPRMARGIVAAAEAREARTQDSTLGSG
ncbi:MAG: SDR family oxidoreductase [Acidimicrobiia bacterium]